jgi:hypothetical protein
LRILISPDDEGSEVSSKCWYPLTSQHGVITQKTTIRFFAAVKTANLEVKFISELNYERRLEDVWESGGIAPPFLILALHGGGWSASSPFRVTSRETTLGTHSRSGRNVEKSLAPAGNLTPTPRPSSP